MAIVGLPTVAELLDLVALQRQTKLAVERRRVERTQAHEKLINAKDDYTRARARINLAAAEEAVKVAANAFVDAEHNMYRAADYLAAAETRIERWPATARGARIEPIADAGVRNANP